MSDVHDSKHSEFLANTLQTEIFFHIYVTISTQITCKFEWTLAGQQVMLNKLALTFQVIHDVFALPAIGLEGDLAMLDNKSC